jgi:hypothetical protein
MQKLKPDRSGKSECRHEYGFHQRLLRVGSERSFVQVFIRPSSGILTSSDNAGATWLRPRPELAAMRKPPRISGLLDCAAEMIIGIQYTLCDETVLL